MTQPLSLGRVVLYCLKDVEAAALSKCAVTPYAPGDEVAATVVRIQPKFMTWAVLEIHPETLGYQQEETAPFLGYTPDIARQLTVDPEPADPPQPGRWRWPPRV